MDKPDRIPEPNRADPTRTDKAVTRGAVVGVCTVWWILASFDKFSGKPSLNRQENGRSAISDGPAEMDQLWISGYTWWISRWYPSGTWSGTARTCPSGGVHALHCCQRGVQHAHLRVRTDSQGTDSRSRQFGHQYVKLILIRNIRLAHEITVKESSLVIIVNRYTNNAVR